MNFFGKKTRTYKLTGTTRDIGKMLYESTLLDDQENLIENYTKNNYLEKSKKALNTLEKTEQEYEYVLEHKENFTDWVLDNTREKTLETAFNLMLPGVVLDNLAAKVLATTSNTLLKDIEYAKKKEEAYNNYYDAVVDGVNLAQTIGSSIRQEDFYYHIGVGNQNQISVFELDLDVAHQFEKDKTIFEITKNKNGNFVFRTKMGLTEEDILTGLINANANNIIENEYDQNLMNKAWANLREDNAMLNRHGNEIKPADLFEIFDSNVIDYQYQTQYYNEKVESSRNTWMHNFISGYAAGDNTYLINDTQIGIQNKFFNTDLEDRSRMFNITSVNSLKEALDIYSDKKTMEKLVKKEYDKNREYIGDSDSPYIPEDIANDAEQVDQWISENIEEEAETAADNWIADNW